MNLGNAAWGFRNTPLQKQLRITNGMGLSLLELSINDLPPAGLGFNRDQAKIKEILRLYKSNGISLKCVSTSNDFTLESSEKCHEEAEKVKTSILIASKLGAKVVRIFAGFSPLEKVTADRWDVMIGCLKEVSIFAKDADMELAIETHGGVQPFKGCVRHYASVSTSIESVERILAVLPDNSGILFDPANLSAVGDDNPAEFYSHFKERVKCIHLKDFAPFGTDGAVVPVACGEGLLDWTSLMEALKDYDGPALIEYENVEDAEEGFRRSLDFLQSIERIKL